MARIVDHLPLEELEARYRAARDATEARHNQAIWLLAQGRTILEVVPSRDVLEIAVAVSGAMTVSRQAARSIMILAGG
jgi:hypothetical protein